MMLGRKLITRRLGGPLKAAIKNVRNEIKAARLSRSSAKSLQHLADKELKIHLGCGTDLKPDWVNLDLQLDGSTPRSANGHAQFFNYDIRHGVPFSAGTCAIIYSSHFFEHLTYQEGVELMRDCYRALRPGGVFRICLPDFKRCFAAYLNKDRAFFDLIDLSNVLPEVERETETLVDYINYTVYQSGEHKCVYDDEKLIRLLLHIGFSKVEHSTFQAGIDVDSETRRHFSFYVEAVK